MAHPFKLIFGLGNPGKEYEHTYHNAGALAVASFAGKEGVVFVRPKGKHFAFAKAGGLIFALPAVFMNESGIAATEALRFFKLKPKDLCVVHDDSDIELGNYKVSFGRGSAGHHGVDSIAKTLGAAEFTRVRIGIRPNTPPSPSPLKRERRKKAGEFVLARISPAHKKELYRVFEGIMDNVIEKNTPSLPDAMSVSGTLTL